MVWAKYREMERLFGMFDFDGGGTVDAAEMRVVLTSMAQHPTEDEIQEVMATGDAAGDAEGNGDGELDFTEFVAVLVQRSRGRPSCWPRFMSFERPTACFSSATAVWSREPSPGRWSRQGWCD